MNFLQIDLSDSLQNENLTRVWITLPDTASKYFADRLLTHAARCPL